MAQKIASIILPALNEADAIGHVLSSIPQDWVHEILVVDGGSTDGTIQIAAKYGARVIHESRRGYGWACHSGLLAASGEFVVFIDADGADDPRHLPQLLSPLVNGHADLVLGSRLAGKMDKGAMPGTQWAGNVLASAMFSGLYHLHLTDLSPFRAAPRLKLLELHLVEMTYGYPTEMIAKAARRGWRILEVPVSYHRRLGGKSKIAGTWRGTLLASYHILKLILSYSRS